MSAALGDLWAQHQQALRHFLQARLDSEQDIEDVLQEVMLKALQSLNTTGLPDNSLAWLYRVTRHALVDHYRKRSAERAQLAQISWYDREAQQVRDELVPCLLPLIQALPEAEARLLSDIDLHGVAQKTYAERHALPYSTLKSQVQQSRRHLKALFEQCCHFAYDAAGHVSDCDAKETDCADC